MAHTHVTAPTQYVEASGIRFAYRRFGVEANTPLVLTQHFRGGMDHWDPAVTDGLAAERPVILFNNAGVASSTGEAPDTIDAMARHAADFIAALGLTEVDLLGFSMGGYVAQSLVLQNPVLVRRLLLVGTGPAAETCLGTHQSRSTQRPRIRARVTAHWKLSYTCSSRRPNEARPREERSGSAGIVARTMSIHPARSKQLPLKAPR